MAHNDAVTGWLHDDPNTQREFERVGKKLLDNQQIINAIASALGITPTTVANTDPKDIALWALTIFIDGKHLINKKIVQGVNYDSFKAKVSDPDFPLAHFPIYWEGENRPLGKEYRTIDEAERTDLQAWATAPLLELTAIKGPMSVTVFREILDLRKYGMKGRTGLNTVQLVNDEVDPERDYYYGTGPNKNKGWWPLSNGSGRLEVDFTWEDIFDFSSKDIGTIPANKRVFKASVLIHEAFDDNAKISLGDDGANGILAVNKDTDLSVETSYDIELEVLYTEEKLLKIYQIVGMPTVGSGTVIIYYM